MAIAPVAGATVIYSDDPHIKKLVGTAFEVFGVADLPLPPQETQISLQFDP